MMENEEFDLRDFMPYLLNQAAERLSVDFQANYRGRYGMLRTEWRVLFHLGRYGAMTARALCDLAGIHKTKVSRAVAALEAKRFLTRAPQEEDRRHETLSLTRAGDAAYQELSAAAQTFDRKLMEAFSEEEQVILRNCLRRIAQLPKADGDDGMA
ncbi:MAG: MarR family transcriptional regulator [Pseudomonadota bacterium]